MTLEDARYAIRLESTIRLHNGLAKKARRDKSLTPAERASLYQHHRQIVADVTPQLDAFLKSLNTPQI
jgi:hypothetical protein